MLGGARHERGGTFYQPTVLTDVTTQMKVTREETFGPVAPLFRFKTEEEAVALANDTEFGLASYFRSEEHTSELQSLMRLSYAVFCLKKKTTNTKSRTQTTHQTQT